MSDTGKTAWIGNPPEVRVNERMLYSELPDEHKVSFMQFLAGKHELTRSGEPVFSKDVYKRWLTLH